MKRIILFTAFLLLSVTGVYAQGQPPCDPVDQFAEKFDAQTTVPPCWTKVGNFGIVSFDGNGLSLPNAMFMQSTSGNTRAVVAMPLVTNAKAGTHRVRFQLKAQNDNSIGGVIQVGYLTDRTDSSTFRPVSNATANSTSYVSLIVDFGTLPDPNVYLAFRHDGSVNTFGAYIDNVYWEPQTSCKEPKNLVASNITESKATVSWESPSTKPGVGFDYYFSTDSTEPTAATQKSGSVVKTLSSVDLPGLTPDTVYYVWVRSDCGTSSKSAWYDIPVKFRTLCNPTALPFTEGFENVQTGNNMFPPCWNYTLINHGVYISNWSTSTTVSFYGGKSLSNKSGVSNAGQTDNWAFTPQFALVAGKSYTYSYYVKSDAQENVGHNLEVKVGNGATPADMTIPVTSETQAIYKTWTKRFATFTPSISGNYTFGLHVFSFPEIAGVINFDEFRVEETPSCAEPLNVTVASTDVTSTTVKVTWIEPAPIAANGYEYYYSTERVKPDSSVAAIGSVPSGSFADVPNLIPGTSYYIWVRSKCNGTDTSAWAGYASFLTPCGLLTTFTEDFEKTSLSNCFKALIAKSEIAPDSGATSGSKVLLMTADNQSDNVNVLQLPELSNLAAGTHRLKLRAKCINGTSQNIHVGYLTIANDANSFVELGTFNFTSQTSYTSFEISPKNILGSVTFLALKIFTTGGGVGGGGSAYVDDLSWTPIPDCLDPVNIKATTVTSTTATLNWTVAAPVATGYEYIYSTSATTPSDSATISGSVGQGVTTVGLQGLSSSTKYYAWVRTICSESSRSPWSDNVNFTTKCAPVDNFSEKFDFTAVGSLPNCWSKAGVGGNVKVQGHGSYSAPNMLGLENQSGVGADFNAMVSLPPVNNSANGSHRIVLKAKAAGATTIPLEIGYMTDTADKSTFVPLKSFPVTANYSTITFKLPVNSQITPFLAFKNALTEASQAAVFIDDVVYELIPECGNPVDIGIADVSSSAANVFWSDDDTTLPFGGYQYYLTKSNVPPTSSTAPSGSVQFQEYSLNLTNLDHNSTYYIWIRSLCDPLFSPWAGNSFKTTCSSLITPPYKEDFSNYIISTNPFAICWTPNTVGNLESGPSTDPDNQKVSAINLGTFLNTPTADSNCLKVQFTGANNRIGWMVSPKFNLSAGNYKVSFDYGLTETGKTSPKYIGFDDSVQLVMLVNDALPWKPVKVFNTNTPVDNVLQTFIGDVLTSASSVQFAFYADAGPISDGFAYEFFIDNFKIEGTLALNTIENNSFVFYPNPVKDVLNISNDLNISHVGVYNLLGQEVIARSLNSNQTQIDMSNLTSGTYLLRVTVEDQVKTIKIIKE